MRRKVRGLRNIERRMLAERTEPAATLAQPAPAQETVAPAAQQLVTPAPPALSHQPAVTAATASARPAITTARSALLMALLLRATLPTPPQEPAVTMPASLPPRSDPRPVSEAEQVVLDYCAAVRGILNDDQGGPLRPPGVRMAEALAEVHDSIGRAQMEKKGGLAKAR